MKRTNEKKNNQKISRIQHILYWVLLLYRMKIDLRCQWIVICDCNQFYIVAHYWYNFDFSFFSYALLVLIRSTKRMENIFKNSFSGTNDFSISIWMICFLKCICLYRKKENRFAKTGFVCTKFLILYSFHVLDTLNTVYCTGESICIRRQFYSFINRNDAIYSLLSPYITRVPREL